MSNFLRKTILFGSCYVRTLSPTCIPGFLQNPDFFPLRFFSSSSNQQSFTVSYLVNSLGFSPQAALSASKYLNFDSPDKPDKVVEVFKVYGFTQTQISSLVRIFPAVLVSDTEKTILPKLEFLTSKGFSGPEMAKVLSVYPNFLRRSLTKQIIPTYDFISNLFQSNEKTIAAAKRFPDILAQDVEKYVVPNINILREYGAPDSNIATLFVSQPRAFTSSLDRFRGIVEKVVEMGFDASKLNFVVAVRAFLSMSESVWESKVDAYKKWGWSEEDVLKAFQCSPWCMIVSKDKIMASMDFFINQMGWRPCLLVKCPALFGLSLKKRVVPRCSVFQFLLSKGLVKKEVSFHALLVVSEKKFLQKFVVPYEEEAPELLKLYKKKLDLSNEPPVDKVGEVCTCK
ncbi:transcription termination factor MTERF15, mitochondrial-like [Morus notabilis]|uniref:transcription termination factor MTERF15, mitochondrial-like n=1 Tax=Morus notabilis TaxID=981085 RepID=UPI000CED1E1F|nr:transcription termination factor MTERF15, mitochondrial-like [Morus notabilis]